MSLIQIYQTVKQRPKQGKGKRSRLQGSGQVFGPRLLGVSLQVKVHFPTPDSDSNKQMQTQEANCSDIRKIWCEKLDMAWLWSFL